MAYQQGFATDRNPHQRAGTRGAAVTRALPDTPQDDLAPSRLVFALIVAVPVWALLGMLAALAWRWL
jgi:hypothetical protein